MLKFSIYSGVWILTILLLIASVTRTKKYSIINNVNDFSHQCHRNPCDHQYRGQLKSSNYNFVSFTYVLQHFINISLNNTCPYDILSIKDLNKLQSSPKNKFKNISVYSENVLVPNSFVNVIKYYVNYTHHIETQSIFVSNTSSEFISKSKKKQRDYVDYPWKRRTLCAISDDGQYSADIAFQNNVFGDTNEKENAGKKKTLLDYDGPVFMNDVGDLDSLKAHVRVKRSQSESSPGSSFAYQQDYLKDLANSFPQNSYESIDENSYDDDASSDTKREIKLQEFFANDEQFIGSNDPEVGDQNDQSKIFDINSFTSLSSSNGDESAGNYFISKRKSFSSEEVSDAPPGAIKADTFAGKNVRSTGQTRNEEIVSSKGPSKEYVSVVNQRSQDVNSEILNLPEDPMLAVELVRKKRNNHVAAEKKRNLQKKALSSRATGDIIIDSCTSNIDRKNIVDANDEEEKLFNEEKRSVLDPRKSASNINAESQNRIPSELVIADLKADLLRFKRRAKNDRRDKSSKAKKKKKHAGKKNNDMRSNSARSAKNVRSKSTDRSRSFRQRKNSETRSEGKPNVGFARVAIKRNNDNNFRRRSVKSKKSIKRIENENENDRSSMLVASSQRARLKKVDENNIDTDNSERLLAEQSGSFAAGSDASDLKAGSDKSTVVLTGVEERGALAENRSIIPTVDGSKLRAKRDKDTEANHGFLNEEDELRYYEDIREQEPETVRYADEDKSSHLGANEAEGGRAVRSIEEVKELVKKLVAKVNELDNYLSVDEAKRNDKGEKRIESRGIDDLCSNVTTACAVFKEPLKIVQRCVPSTKHEFTSTTKIIIDRKTDASGNADARERFVVKSKHSLEKRRSAHAHAPRMPPSTARAIRKANQNPQGKWGRWTDWSSCSVTCGKGRQIRWRYCLRDCSTAETEMEEKACQLPACPPGKFLGIF